MSAHSAIRVSRLYVKDTPRCQNQGNGVKMWYNVSQMTSKKVREAIIRARVERIMEAGQQTGQSQAYQGDTRALEASQARLAGSLGYQECAVDTSIAKIARDAYEVLAQRHALGFDSKDD